MRNANSDFDMGVNTMGRSSKKWPRIRERKYQNGASVWEVDLGKRNGHRPRRSFHTRGEAETYAQQARIADQQQGDGAFFLPMEIQMDARRLHDLLKPHGISLNDVLDHYAEEVIPYLAAPNLDQIAGELLAVVKADSGDRHRWPQTLGNFLKNFCAAFPDRKITEIKKAELSDFIFEPNRVQPLSPKTLANRRAMASELYNFAIDNDWATTNLAKRLRSPRIKNISKRIFTVDEAQRLLSCASQFEFLAYAAIGLFGGIRPEELEKMDWALVHKNDGIIEVPDSVAKIGVAREVAINETLAAWLELCYKNSGPIVDLTNFDDRFDQWRASAGVLDDWGKDPIRKSFASYHLAMFQNAHETARQMGHIDTLRTMYKYYRVFVPRSVATQYWALRPTAVPVAAAA